MLGFIKKCFVIGLTFLSNLTSVNSLRAALLSCISMNNQKCRVRPQIVNLNGDEPVSFPFSIKTSKFIGTCNNIINPYAKLCVPDVIKNLNVKVCNPMSRTNETRHIEWHEMRKSKCRLDASVCSNKQRWNNDKCRWECRELIDKGVCDKGSILNPSNCECKYNELCDVGQYLDYENCKCRKKLVDKLFKECTENVEIVKITSADHENKHKYSSCSLYIILFSILFKINVGIDTYFVYCKYMNCDKKLVLLFRQQLLDAIL